MVRNHEQFLAELAEKSRADQAQFIGHISNQLGRPRPEKPPAHPYRGAPDFWLNFDLPINERAELFINNWRAVGGTAERLPDLEAAKAYIVQTAHTMQAKRLLRQDQPELSALQLEAALPEAQFTVWNEGDADMKSAAADADIGVGFVDYAVAATGSIVIKSAAHAGRSVSLLPTAYIAIIPIAHLYTRLGEVMKQLRAPHVKEMPAGVHFISGPSRSADIENDLTIGVHGPGIVFALVVG